jgi:hexosaminidase
LANPVRIVVPASAPRVREIGDLLADVIRERTGFTVRVRGGGPSAGAIVLDTALIDANAEAYAVVIGAKSIALHGATSAGALWAVQTLRQLLPPEFDDPRGIRPAKWLIAAVDIRDAPRFAWRGSLVDVGRHFFPVPVIKRHIDVLSRYKMNVFHWHLTEDQGWRIEIRRYPKLTSVGAWRTEADGSRYGGFYTQRDIRDVVEFARQRGVTVVPEIEMPGHSSAALAAYPELGCTGQPIDVATQWGVFADIYCAGNERTFEFLTNVLDEVMALFPSRYIHIGGDEVPKERWKACTSCQDLIFRQGLANETELQSWFVRRIGEYLAMRGRRIIGWNEVLQAGLPASVTVHAWEDTSFTRKAVLAGRDAIASPVTWTYFNRTARELTLDQAYQFEPMPPGLDSSAARHVLGGEAALWSEGITSPATLDLMAFPRMLALAEVLWSDARKDIASFRARLESDHLPRLHAMGVAVGPLDREIADVRIQYDSISKVARVRTDVGVPGVTLRGTTDGSAPTLASPLVADSSALVGDGTRRLQPFYSGAPSLSERVVTLVRNKALGKSTTAAVAPQRQYPGTGAWNLTDGLAGSIDHADGLWQGWWGKDVDVVVDLESVQPIEGVRVTFLQNVRSWIVFPSSVEVSVSDDRATWRSIPTVAQEIPANTVIPAMLHTFETAPTAGVQARFIRVIGHNSGSLPSWHPGAGSPSWLFADEIVIR